MTVTKVIAGQVKPIRTTVEQPLFLWLVAVQIPAKAAIDRSSLSWTKMYHAVDLSSRDLMSRHLSITWNEPEQPGESPISLRAQDEAAGTYRMIESS